MSVYAKIGDPEQCYHCGNDAVNGEFRYEGQNFCCVGCQSVYTILLSNNLSGYYQLEDQPGSRQTESTDLSYLDAPDIVKDLLDYQNNTHSVVRFYIPAIHCSSCIWLLEHLYKIDAGIYRSRVDFLKKEITIHFKHQEISLRKVVQHLVDIGYEPLISSQDVVKEKTISDRSLIKKIAVAGFAMGNVMLFSFPEYLGMGGEDESFKYLFGWLNLLFCIPVTFYCAQDFFKSSFHHLKQGRVNLDLPLALIIAVLFLRTAFEIIFDVGPGFADTLTGLLFLLLVGKWVKQRTYHHISFDRDFRSYFPLAVTVLKEGVERPTQLNALRLGDRILVRNGELVPADAILMRGEGWFDMSFVTGESEPEQKVIGEMTYAGGRQRGEAIELEIIKPVSQSYLTSLWNADVQPKDALNNFNDKIAKYFVAVVFIIAFVSTAYWILQADHTKAWAAFTAVIIVACPCVLTLSTPFTLSSILSVFDKKGFFVKNTDTVEHMAELDTIVFDKTGTLTDTKQVEILFEGNLNVVEQCLVASLLRNSAHPLSQSVLKYLKVTDYLSVHNFKEVVGAGLEGKMGVHTVRVGSANFLNVQAGLLGKSAVHVQIDEEYKGSFFAKHKFRSGLKPLFTRLSALELHLLSGDSSKSEFALKQLADGRLTTNFGQDPHQKQAYIEQLQLSGRKVMMLGDGLNDSGALKKADVGIAVTDDVNSFSPGCDAIIQGDAMVHLPKFLAFAKDGMRIVKFCFVIAAGYNVVGLYFAVQGTLYPLVAAVLMPVSTLTIILFTTIAARYAARKNRLL